MHSYPFAEHNAKLPLRALAHIIALTPCDIDSYIISGIFCQDVKIHQNTCKLSKNWIEK